VQTAAERFDYLYAPDELAEWRDPVRQLAEETERTWVLFNNCRYDYAPRNAKEMAEILGDVVAPRRGGSQTGDPVAEYPTEQPGERPDSGPASGTLF
jgi:uncharacterized protein YecE (DUF72 family)